RSTGGWAALAGAPPHRKGSASRAARFFSKVSVLRLKIHKLAFSPMGAVEKKGKREIKGPGHRSNFHHPPIVPILGTESYITDPWHENFKTDPVAARPDSGRALLPELPQTEHHFR